jgi:hypothetical protein
VLEQTKEMEHLRRLADTLRQALTDATEVALTASKTKKPGPIKLARVEGRDAPHGRQRFFRPKD